MTKVVDLARVKTTRPAEYADVVSIAEIVVFTPVDPRSLPTVAASIDAAIRAEFRFEVDEDERNELDWRSGFIAFKDGSTLEYKVAKQ